MAGSKFTATFDDKLLRDGLERVRIATDDATPLLRRIGVGLVETTQRRFETATDPAGQAWHPLSRAYAKRKKGLGILREKAMRGGLMGSITYQIEGKDSVAIGSNKTYAAIHQFGGPIKREAHTITTFRKLKTNGEFAQGGRFVKRRHANFQSTHQVAAHTIQMPARPYLGFGPADRAAAGEAIVLTLEALLRGKA